MTRTKTTKKTPNQATKQVASKVAKKQVQTADQKQDLQIQKQKQETEQLSVMNGDAAVLTPDPIQDSEPVQEEPSWKEAISKFGPEDNVVAIIHYNTPELTCGTISSLLKKGGLWNGPADMKVVVFDNSDKRPFESPTHVVVIDNTQGQIIDFDAELAKFPDRCEMIGCAKNCHFGSAKHMMTVQKLWELLPYGFLLIESDILIKKPVAEFFDRRYSVVGYAQKAQPYNPFKLGRMLPMLCYMNVPLLTKFGARYYDPSRTYGLLPGGAKNRNNWYDTGAVLLEDILLKRPHLKGLHKDIRPYVEHYESGSWKNNDVAAHIRWLSKFKHLFYEG